MIRYTLVIETEEEDVVGVYHKQSVYLIDSEKRECFAGHVVAVQFNDALKELEDAKAGTCATVSAEGDIAAALWDSSVDRKEAPK